MKNLFVILAVLLSSLFTNNAFAQNFTLAPSTSSSAEATPSTKTVSGVDVQTKTSKYGNLQVEKRCTRRADGTTYLKWTSIGKPTGSSIQVGTETLDIHSSKKRDGTLNYYAVKLTVQDGVVIKIKRHPVNAN